MVVVPAPTPYTAPDTGSTVPTAVLPLLHTPDPPVAVGSLNVTVWVVQTLFAPRMPPATGVVLTVTTVAADAAPQEAVLIV